MGGRSYITTLVGTSMSHGPARTNFFGGGPLSSDGRRLLALGVTLPALGGPVWHIPRGSVIGSKSLLTAGSSHIDSPDILFQKYGLFSRRDQYLRHPCCSSSGCNSAANCGASGAGAPGVCGVSPLPPGDDWISGDESLRVGAVSHVEEPATTLSRTSFMSTNSLVLPLFKWITIYLKESLRLTNRL